MDMKTERQGSGKPEVRPPAHRRRTGLCFSGSSNRFARA